MVFVSSGALDFAAERLVTTEQETTKMASARKKQDEKNLKIVRELVSLPPNKFCFDCGQRGPTYVNVTIGSFVCTKCSGLLRGLTPPHRVKSISMTTFTAEEVELMRSRGNDYCRRVWLGLYDGKMGTDGSAWDEHAIHQLMLDKYERKRFYMEPNASTMMVNNVSTASVVQHNNQVNNKLNNGTQQQTTASTTIIRPPPMQQHHNNNPNNIILRNGLTHTHRSRTTSSSSASQQPQQQHQQMDNGDFVADFDHADIFTSNNNNSRTMANGNGYSHNGIINGTSDMGFANFDNNPAFKNASFPLGSSNNRSTNHTSTPPPPQPPPVAEDKYAALKDLDESLHPQTSSATAIDWGGSSSSLYSSATSPLSSNYGSPTTAPHFNPFNANGFHVNGSHNHNDMWNMQPQTHVFEQQQIKQQPQQQQQQQSFFPINGHLHNGQASLFGGATAQHSNGVPPANPFGLGGGNGGFVASFPPLSSTMSSANVVSNGMSGNMASTNGGNAAWNCQNPFKLASNGSANNPFL